MNHKHSLFVLIFVALCGLSACDSNKRDTMSTDTAANRPADERSPVQQPGSMASGTPQQPGTVASPAPAMPDSNPYDSK